MADDVSSIFLSQGAVTHWHIHGSRHVFAQDQSSLQGHGKLAIAMLQCWLKLSCITVVL